MDREKVWRKKTAKSPFAVDLVAEDERIQEETRIRSTEEEVRDRGGSVYGGGGGL